MIFMKDLLKKIKIKYSKLKSYNLLSICIYKKHTKLIKENYKGTDRYYAPNKDMIAFLRYNKSKNDIFYIMKDGYVIYDFIAKEDVNFEWE